MIKGKFITFEGSEGSGKSTQTALAFEYLKQKKLPVVLLREPGGVKISEAIRKLLLDVNNTGMGDECDVTFDLVNEIPLAPSVKHRTTLSVVPRPG